MSRALRIVLIYAVPQLRTRGVVAGASWLKVAPAPGALPFGSIPTAPTDVQGAEGPAPFNVVSDVSLEGRAPFRPPLRTADATRQGGADEATPSMLTSDDQWRAAVPRGSKGALDRSLPGWRPPPRPYQQATCSRGQPIRSKARTIVRNIAVQFAKSVRQ